MNHIHNIIADEIRGRGALSFARFMELALYCPVYGYYEAEKDTVGTRGDFITSVSVGSLFGELLAFQFAEWLEEVRSGKCEVRIVEAGAHDGQLAKDILLWLRERRQNLFERLEYCIIEPSATRRQRQAKTLEKFSPRVRWFADSHDSKLETRNSKLRGIIFSNELLDAMPIHRFGWDVANKSWFEWGVTLRRENFAWMRMPEQSCHVPKLPRELLDVLPDGFTFEISPSAENWWREAAEVLSAGKLLTIDYGLTAEEFLVPERSGGTLRAYRRQHVSSDLLADPGEQDLTAHVNFTAIQQAGEAAGLKTEAFLTQTKFLTQIAERLWKTPSDSGEWNSARTRQFQTLTHPEHLGRPFRVLIQAKWAS